MRIDLSQAATSQVSAEENKKQVVAQNQVQHDGETKDKTTLSTDREAVGALSTQAMQTPPVRQEKVAALREAINKGEYKLEPGKIADAIIKDHSE